MRAIYAYTCINAPMYIHIYMYVYTYIYIYIYICMRVFSSRFCMYVVSRVGERNQALSGKDMTAN